MKAELSRVAWKRDDEACAELTGIRRTLGADGPLALSSPAVARRAFALAKALDLAPHLLSEPRRRRYTVTLSRIPRQHSVSREPRALLRGAVLARGYVAAPGRPYHLEMVAPTPEWASVLQAAMAQLGVAAQVATRRQRSVVYVKDHEQVAALLAHLGAHRAQLRLEAESVVRSMKGEVNRRVNGEASNLRRAVETGVAQEHALLALAAQGGWDAWPEAFRRLAQVRLDHPDWTLEQLGRAMVPPMSKSSVAYRLRRMLTGGPPQARPPRGAASPSRRPSGAGQGRRVSDRGAPPRQRTDGGA